MTESVVQTNPEQEGSATAADHGIVFFDGVCGLCNQFVDFLLRIDRKGVLRFAPLQGETADRLIAEGNGRANAGLSRDDLESLDSVVFVHRKQAFRGSSAVVQIFAQLGWFWRVVSFLMWIVPRPIRDAVYRFIARNRYKWFGQKETCRMPTESERSRLLP